MTLKYLVLCLGIFVHNTGSQAPGGREPPETYPTTLVFKTIFSPKILLNTCLLTPKTGPCRANIPMYYYDPALKKCNTFAWGGCQGNGNRYDTLEECQIACISTNETKIQRPKWCNLRFDYGFCFGNLKRFYYDKIWQTCKETIYSGCGGNKNNFYNLAQCESICRFNTGKITRGRSDMKGYFSKVLVLNPWDATTKKSVFGRPK